jgi:predicted membrane protein
MKTRILSIAILLFAVAQAYSQEYKLAKNSGKLVIKEVNHVTIEGHSGNDIIFTSLDGPRDKDKRAEGLRSLNSMGLEDNTGIGLSVVDKGNTIEVYQLKKMDGPKVKILIPKGVSVSYSHSSPYGDEVRLKNIESEIEVSTLHNGVVMENVTGPATIKTVHGEIEGGFGANIKSPISLVSVHGLIDITIPAATKANVSLATSYGEMFVDPAIKIEFPEESEWKKYGGNKIAGKINGGGIELTLSSTHNNIYLRKK